MSRPKQICALAIAVSLTGVLPGCTVYGKGGFAGCPGDAKITADVQALFHEYSAMQPPNLVYVQTLDHVVYLSGRVNTDLERLTAETVALSVADVTRVVNSISLGYSGR
jgi:osmotically-inducible protein OsmY